MLIVNTYLAPSSVHGIGLFAAEPITAGAEIWKFNHHIDKVFRKEIFLAICKEVDPHTMRHLLNSSYKRGDRYFYLTDNARFINHSPEHYNIAFAGDFTEVACRDIGAGEELLENYLHAYDENDFFFQELVNPDPFLYLNTIYFQKQSHA